MTVSKEPESKPTHMPLSFTFAKKGPKGPGACKHPYILDHRSELTFEEIAAFFDKKPRNVGLIVNMYHWSETIMTKADILSKPLYVCDNSYSWNSIGFDDLHLHRVECLIRNPLIKTNQWVDSEQTNLNNAISKRRIGNRPVEVVIHTPHKWSDEPELREMLILNASKNVLDIEHIDTYRKGAGKRKWNEPIGIDIDGYDELSYLQSLASALTDLPSK